jgi:hypoxanthine phosphoribosyltransferase
MTKVLYTEEQILKRVGDIAREVEKDFEGGEISVVGLLEDSFVFMADLIRKVNREVLCYFMKADVDEGEDRIASIKRILYSPELDARDRNILLVGGVLDTGITLDYITKHILQGGPRRLKICYLIDKPESRRISISADYAAFAIQAADSEYLVGYGLGYRNRFRNLPCLGTLSDEERLSRLGGLV